VGCGLLCVLAMGVLTLVAAVQMTSAAPQGCISFIIFLQDAMHMDVFPAREVHVFADRRTDMCASESMFDLTCAANRTRKYRSKRLQGEGLAQ